MLLILEYIPNPYPKIFALKIYPDALFELSRPLSRYLLYRALGPRGSSTL